MGSYGKLWAGLNNSNPPNQTLLGSSRPLWAGLVGFD